MQSKSGSSTAVDFVVDRNDLHRCKFVDAPSADQIELQAGQALLRVASFAFTANNVTYAVAGDMLSYWSFFPAEAGLGKNSGVGVRRRRSFAARRREAKASASSATCRSRPISWSNPTV